jgi:hypothetical protein
MLELLITATLSTAGFTITTLLWFSDKASKAERRTDSIEKNLQRIELESKYTKELIETRFTSSLDAVSAELLDLKINIQALHKRFDKLKGFDLND